VTIAFAIRSVTTSAEPSGLKPTWAGSEPASSGRVDPATGSRPAAVNRKPHTDGSPVLSTYTSPSCSATLLGAEPAEAVPIASGPSPSTAKTDTSPLPALVTSSARASPVSVMEPWDARCGTPSPAPPVSIGPGPDSTPLGLVRKANSLLPSRSLLWT
jgi:hypothetical protein